MLDYGLTRACLVDSQHDQIMLSGKNSLKMRFAKIQHEVLIKKKKTRGNKLLEMDAHPHYTPKIQCFSNIAGQ